MKLFLLGTAGCHLCELAEEMVNYCLANTSDDIKLEQIDIAEQTQWQADFATLIPVLLHERTNNFLNWPFTEENVLTFIEQHHD